MGEFSLNPMSLLRTVALAAVVVATQQAPVQAQDASIDDVVGTGATVAIVTPQPTNRDSTFVTLSTGNVVFVRGQRFVVTAEPAPAAVLTDPPPPPPTDILGPGDSPAADSVWVPGHWVPVEEGFAWAEGQHVVQKVGHAFVPPRWVFINGRHLFFAGFFVPHRVWVRSFFNTFHFSGAPSSRTAAATRDRGPYWPIGFRGPSVSISRSPGRGPYWPLGLGPPTTLNRGGGTVVGLPSNNARR
ncbi:MAG: hypothetical protein WBG86_05025 [Polyangiales bacterium]